MGNAIEYECKECDYYEHLHCLPFPDGERRSIYSDKFRNKCCNCTRPTRLRMSGKGIYPPAEGGFTIKEEV